MAGRNFKRSALNVAMETVRGASLLRRPPIPWEITWFPSWTCNLKCYYCCVPHENFYKPNPEKACQKIIDLKPASVSILGGEPFLIKEMPDYLRRIREELPNVYLFITTNGIVSTEKLVQSAPYLNVLCVSIDGFDEYNKKPRGVGSDRIMKNVWAYNDARKHLDKEHEICINTVVTADNAKHLPDFIQHIADKDPSIYVMCQAMHPINAPTGLGNFPELTEEFISRIAKMQKEGVRVFLVGMLADDRTRMKSDESHVEEAPTKEEDIHHRICQEKLQHLPSGKILRYGRTAWRSSHLPNLCQSEPNSRPDQRSHSCPQTFAGYETLLRGLERSCFQPLQF